MSATPISLCFTADSLIDKAQQLAESLALQVTTRDPAEAQLVVTEQRLELAVPELGNPLFVDFVGGKSAHRRQFGGGKGQPIARAIGIKKPPLPQVLDATAGFGLDAFVFASLGCDVTLIERNPFMAALLADGIERAREDTDTAEIASRMQLLQGNAAELMLSWQHTAPDVIYLDPMYPSRDKSALVKKEMQLLHQLVGMDSDADELLAAARKLAQKRVVVKRPKSAPNLADKAPSAVIASKNTRYDLYF
jgi:16S rRNA (guanine1516-N2)-methyltransferase